MIDWNYIASVIATVAFDIIYFGAIIGTIVIVILDNRNPGWFSISFLGVAKGVRRLSVRKVMTVCSKNRWQSIWRRTAVKRRRNMNG